MVTTRGSKTERLLEAAVDVFHEHGFHRAKVSDITAAAGTAQGTFYLYFSSKEEIFLEVLRRFGSDIESAVLGFSWEGLASIDELADELRDLLVRIFTVCADQRKAARLFFGVAPTVSDQAAAIPRQLVLAAEKITAGYLIDGMNEDHVRPLDVEVISRAIVGYVLHTMTRTIIEEGRRDHLEELADELLRFELYGILLARYTVE